MAVRRGAGLAGAGLVGAGLLGTGLAAYIGAPYVLTQYLGLGTVRAGDLGGRNVALTFDDGPHPVYTPRVLHALAAADMRATFFVLSGAARRYPDLLQRMQAEGHEIGIHAAHHRHAWARFPANAYADPLQARGELAALLGHAPTLVRPPHGAYTAANLLAYRRAGLTPVHWSVEGGDWRRGMSPTRLRQRLRTQWHGGAVAVLHDAGKGGPITAAAIGGLLEDIAALGLQSVTVGELGARPITPRQLPAQAMARLDEALDSAFGIKPAAGWHGGLFRVQPLRFPLGGLPIPRGTPALEFHVNNPLLVDIGLRRFIPRARREFALVAHDLCTRLDCAAAQYVYCLSTHGPVLERLGFASAPLPATTEWRLGLWSRAMHWAYATPPRKTAAVLSYISRAEFLQCFG